ncbi:unnamed protein product [Chironomus riparius]|uniref:Uncharacterized protein n=1 Tax=Chironomus riparius TaxID=315576 RepID=A0A9N9WSP7_9DIPT|nr:unnamed protein product [Chironomus riparius]
MKFAIVVFGFLFGILFGEVGSCKIVFPDSKDYQETVNKTPKPNPLLKAQTCIEVSEDGECLGEEGESVEDFLSERFFLVSPKKKCKDGYKLGPGNKCRKVIKVYDIRSSSKNTQKS